MSAVLEAVPFALTTIFLAVVLVVTVVAADILVAHGRLTRCAQCHRYYVAIQPGGHLCHRGLVSHSWYALRERGRLLGIGHHHPR